MEVDFNNIIAKHNLKRCTTYYSDNDLELPYVFDLLWDIKTVGHLKEALSSEYLHPPSRDIYETMKEYGLEENNLISILRN